jgi:low temperature requirement protein LtrA
MIDAISRRSAHDHGDLGTKIGRLASVTMPPTTQPGPTEPVVRVSTLELFFDLVFVFTITQLTAYLADDLSLRGIVRVVLILGVTSWMYGGYAWLTNAVAPTTRFRRTLMLIGMGGFLAIALAIPDAFGANGWLFGLGYFVVNAVHSGLFIVAGGPGSARAMAKLAPFNFTSATLVLVGGFLPGWWRYAAWGAAFLVMIASPYLNPINEFNISPAHFVERHGLLIIIALGESIIAIGVGVAGLELDLRIVLIAVLGLTLSYLMWWVYFGGDQEQAEHALAAVEPTRRARVALAAFGWAHYFLLLGIVVVAAGVKKAVGHAFDHLTFGQALALAGGLAIYLLGDVAFRRVLRIGRLRYRAIGAVLALATIPVGLAYAGAQIALLIVLLVAVLTVEDRAQPRPAVEHAAAEGAAAEGAAAEGATAEGAGEGDY